MGKKLSQDTKIKLSKNKKENFSKEHLDKMLKAFHKSKCYKILRKSILQYDLNDNFIKEWESITKAAEHYSKILNKNIKSIGSKISLVCKGKRKKTINYIWKYK